MTVDVLVTGSRGFVGQYLVPLLVHRGLRVAGWVRGVDGPPGAHESGSGDLSDPRAADEALDRLAPRIIVHLAGSTRAASSKALLDDNVLATINLLQSTRRVPSPPRVVLVSSSAVYGASDRPLDESAPTRPASLYGVVKVAQELAAQQIAGTSVPLVVARLFNLLGPGQGDDFVLGRVARQIAEAELRGPATIEVRNTLTSRDFVDVRDAARALALLAVDEDASGTFNVATGTARPIADAIQLLVARATCDIQVSSGATSIADGDVLTQTGDPGRLHRATGWSSAHSFEESIDALLEHWRANARRDGAT